jgi:hypothetical protein
VDAHVTIDELGDVDVYGHAGQHVRLIAAQVLLLNQEIDHVAYGESRGFFQVWTETHADVGGRRLGSWPKQMLVFVNDKPESAGEKGFECRDVDFTVALAGMPIAHFEERSLGVHRDE